MPDPEMALIHIRNALRLLEKAAESFERADVPKIPAILRSMVADMTPAPIEQEPEGAEIIPLDLERRVREFQ